MISFEVILTALIALLGVAAAVHKWLKKHHDHDEKKHKDDDHKKKKDRKKKDKKHDKSESEHSSGSESDHGKCHKKCKSDSESDHFSSSSSESEKDHCKKDKCDKIKCCKPPRPTKCDVGIVFQRDCVPCNVNPPIICGPCIQPTVGELITSLPCASACSALVLENIKHIIELARCKNPCLNVHLIDVSKGCDPTRTLRKYEKKGVKVFILLTPCATTFQLLPFFRKECKKRKVLGIDVTCGSTSYTQHDGIIKLIASANSVADALTELIVNVLSITEIVLFDYVKQSEVTVLLSSKLVAQGVTVFSQSIDFCQSLTTQIDTGLANLSQGEGSIPAAYIAFGEYDLSVFLNKGATSFQAYPAVQIVSNILCAFPEISSTVAATYESRLFTLYKYHAQTPESEYVLKQLRLCLDNPSQSYQILVVLDALEVAARYCATKCIEKARAFTGLTGVLIGECEGSLKYWAFLVYQLTSCRNWKPYALIEQQPNPVGLASIVIA